MEKRTNMKKKKKFRERVEDWFDLYDAVEAIFLLGRFGKKAVSAFFKLID